MIFLQLFWAFLQVGAFSIGGGYVAMPLIQSRVVEYYGWLTTGEFADLVSISEMTPGPIVVNAATFVGMRTAGLPGACAATFGAIAPSLLIVSALGYLYFRYQNMAAMQGVLSALRPVVVALIAAAGLSILKTAVFAGGVISFANVNWLQLTAFALSFYLLRRYKWNPIGVIALCGGLGLLFSLF